MKMALHKGFYYHFCYSILVFVCFAFSKIKKSALLLKKKKEKK